MKRKGRILVSAGVAALGLMTLAACGQKGALVLPNEAAAQQRATLPQTLRIGVPAPSAPASSPRTTP